MGQRLGISNYEYIIAFIAHEYAVYDVTKTHKCEEQAWVFKNSC